MAEKKKYLDYKGLKTVVENVIEYTDSAVDQKSQVQIIESGETEFLSTLEIYKVTQEEYDKAVEDGTIVENAIYLTPDEDIDLSSYATIEQLNSKADEKHSHEIEDVAGLQTTLDSMNDVVSGKANTIHSHAISDVDELQVKLDEKADIGHTHDYAASSHSHDDVYYTEEEIDGKIEELEQSISEKAEVSHVHTDVHYTKEEVDELLSQKSQVQIITWEVDD